SELRPRSASRSGRRRRTSVSPRRSPDCGIASGLPPDGVSAYPVREAGVTFKTARAPLPQPAARALQAIAELRSALPRVVRLGARHVARVRRADGRRLRPHPLGAVGERAPDRRLPADDRDRPPLRAAPRPALAAGAHGRRPPRPPPPAL